MKLKPTVHLDGSDCLWRNTVPGKSQIAKYWRDKIFELEFFLEWMQNRRRYSERRYEDYKNAFKEFNHWLVMR